MHSLKKSNIEYLNISINDECEESIISVKIDDVMVYKKWF